MIPIGDDNRPHRAPVVSRTIILICCLAYWWQATQRPWGEFAAFALGFTPASFFGGGPSNAMLDWVPYAATLITYTFLHGSWLHLLSNILFLWIFGDDVEDAFGHAGFIAFYLGAGAAAALVQAWPEPGSAMPVIGASGAVSGVLGAYILLYPRTQVRVLVPIFIVVDIVRLPAWLVLAFWFGVQLAYEMTGAGAGGNIAFRAHIGGFLFGMLAMPIFVRMTAARVGGLARERVRLLR